MRFCDDHGLPVTAGPRWLAPHKAADLLLQHRPTPDHMRGLRALLGADKIDALVVNAETRRKKILLADMDATIVAGETLDMLGALVGKHGAIAAITHAAMAGTLDFHTALARRMDLTLLTSDRDFEALPDVRAENWLS